MVSGHSFAEGRHMRAEIVGQYIQQNDMISLPEQKEQMT